MRLPRILLGVVLASVGFVGSAIAFYYGWQMKTLAQVAKAEPQQLSAANLVKNGPGDNPYVQLVDFSFGKPVIDQTDDQWDRVWVPILPAEANKKKHYGVPIAFFQTTRIHDQGRLDELLDSKTLSAFVATTSLNKTYWGSSISSGLYLKYPNINMDRVVIFSEPIMDVPGTGIVLQAGVLTNPLFAMVLLGSSIVLALVGFLGAYFIASHEQKPKIDVAICRVDRKEGMQGGVTTHYISTIPRRVVDAAEVQRQRELVKIEHEQSSHDFNSSKFVTNMVATMAGIFVLMIVLAVALASGASATREMGPIAAACTGLFGLVVFTAIMFFLASNLDIYFHHASRIQVCASGLRWMQGKEPRLASWLEVASAERITIDVNPTNTAITASFGLVGALAVAMSQPDHSNLKRTSDKLTLFLHNGEKLFFSSDCLTEYRWFADSIHQLHGTEAKRFDPMQKIETNVRAAVMPGRSNKTMMDYGR